MDIHRWGVFAAGAAVAAVACAKVPYTGRTQPNLIPNGLMNTLGETTYGEMLAGEDLVTAGNDVKLLKEVGQRIAAQTGEDYAWEYKLVKSDTVNAWCLPGGKIAFYEGVLPVLQSEAGMAFVMGHEVGHAVAHHSAERLSEQLAVLGGLAGVYAILETKTAMKDEHKAIVLGALGVGAEIGIVLPFSRMHESEADVIGAMYMSGAGYPPDEALDVWDRMEAISPSSTPQFLSTHPTNATRQEALKDWMPKAQKRYQRNRLGHDTLASLWGKGAP